VLQDVGPKLFQVIGVAELEATLDFIVVDFNHVTATAGITPIVGVDDANLHVVSVAGD